MDSRWSTIRLRVRGYHLDGYGHVNNARYLEFLEEGRWAYFDERADLAGIIERGDVAFVAVNLNIDYRRAALAGDDLKVVTGLAELGTRSARMHQEVRRDRDDKLVASADLTFVLLDVRSNKAVAIEGELRDLMAPLVIAQ
ncbi:acyl-CoA thioesterase [Halomonas eurihalina]|uniref:Acyl-CoA thioesterase n=1 Tax=Halomonas eurihalina TaxID=42566 RepID=A0A5D9D5T2_HALER|nr:thioesterase family protein [Halomonas eurihalina]MDR5858780.1 thioesterase family protein [Halomonas eurihalina]TZG38919.1 acyl-CoA thioesterase [Halomonas eurihalina]